MNFIICYFVQLYWTFFLVFLVCKSYKFERIRISTKKLYKELYSKNDLLDDIKLKIEDDNANYLNSLQKGQWIKLICGASNQDIPLIRNLCYIYTTASVDCIDLSADIAVIKAANEGITAAMNINQIRYKPLLMISVNDDEDPHFRKAYFNPSVCPSDCTRPCEKICPALAIPSKSKDYHTGVIEDRCYGCGRCFSICPYNLIQSQSYQVTTNNIIDIVNSGIISAIEIHTLSNHESRFQSLWSNISASLLSNLKVIAISFPDMGNNTISYIESLQNIISSSPQYSHYNGIQIWQTDGRPMSGDIGKGATYQTCQLALKILNNNQNNIISFNGNKHFVQLAGGANIYSSSLASSLGLIGKPGFGGYGFGGYARKTISAYLQELEDKYPGAKIEDYPDTYLNCLEFAKNLVNSVKEIYS